MNASSKMVLGAAAVAIATASLWAGDFHSEVITSSTLTVNINDGHFIKIWNFTQEGGSQRGVVAATTNSGTANVLSASVIDSTSAPGSSTLEPVNQVVIAGPAQINVAPVSGATLFITYRKEPNEEGGSGAAVPTPTVTPTVTATPTPTATP